MALLLYGRLPTIIGLSKTDTAAVVGEVLHKNERTIRRWVDDFMSNGGEFSARPLRKEQHTDVKRGTV